ncbi:MAG: beta-propeller domain-containing protein, partial [Propionibacteriaceae bacterium]|nr:beta-propeller domain-containing protein [Propionibacteriaceae bacterium]
SGRTGRTGAGSAAPPGRNGRAWWHRLAPSALGGGLAVGLAVALSGQTPVWPGPQIEIPVVTAPAQRPESQPTVAEPTDYSQLYERIAGLLASSGGDIAISGSTTAPAGGGGMAPAALPREDSYTGASSYTGTNVQVTGIDEGDLIKTDGQTIFVARGDQVVLFAADGPATRPLARIELAEGPALTPSSAVLDLMVWQSRLVIFTHDYVATEVPLSGDRNAYVTFEATRTRTLVYDIADPAQPKLVDEFTQSGSYQTSRLSDSTLHLVTRYFVRGEIDLADPTGFVPELSGPDGSRLAPPEDIHIMPLVDQPSYAVVSAVDLAAGRRLGQTSVLGGNGPTYMSPDNLYLSAIDYGVETYRDWGIEIWPGSSGSAPVTHLVRLALAGGPRLAASATIDGVPRDQFALDEYEGHLRVVTTVQELGVVWHERVRLSVLDLDLNLVGSIPSLVEDETIQSIRFSGPTGYVVTFQFVDPLFSLDLSDPAHPQVLGALEIPGFSSYLHPWPGDLLLGLGQAGDANGVIDKMKLSLFDLADPRAVSERKVEKLEYDHSEALWDHRAIAVDLERGLIGFLAERWLENGAEWHYLIYSVDGEAGFQLRQTIDLTSALDTNTWSLFVRGFVIDGHFYICSPQAGVQVLELDGFRTVGQAQLD